MRVIVDIHRQRAGLMPAFGYTEPGRGAEWWGRKRLVTGPNTKNLTLSRSNGYVQQSKIKRSQPRSTRQILHSSYTRNTFPPIATATSSTAINPKAKLKLLPWAMNPITAGPARIPA
jgi:hypothetical protein